MDGVMTARSLKEHEEIIESGVKSFIDVGMSLMAIRDERLYRETHSTFEDYCRERWGFTKTHACRLIESAKVVSDLSPIGDKNTPSSQASLPQNEAQARAVAESAPDAKTRAKVWEAAVASAPKSDDGKPKVTAAVVKKIAATIVSENKNSKNGDAVHETNGKHEAGTKPVSDKSWKRIMKWATTRKAVTAVEIADKFKVSIHNVHKSLRGALDSTGYIIVQHDRGEYEIRRAAHYKIGLQGEDPEYANGVKGEVERILEMARDAKKRLGDRSLGWSLGDQTSFVLKVMEFCEGFLG